MKPPLFSYHDPQSLDEALALLGRLENARILAGGQSLLPMLNFRYLQPDHLIDVNGIAALAGITAENGHLHIGAMTRQREVEFSDTIAKKIPLMTQAILQVGHRQTRNRGTVGGSLSHLDPAAELPLCACALGATIHVASKNGRRNLAFPDYALGFMTSALEPDEMVTGASFPVWAEGHGACFLEFARREGDFAIVAVAVLVEKKAGRISKASVAFGGMNATAIRADAVADLLVGEIPSDALFKAAGAEAAKIEAFDDVHAPGSYRQHLAGVLTKRALAQACA
jgi:carbon-monoxide dehydrogenase medium subunit